DFVVQKLDGATGSVIPGWVKTIKGTEFAGSDQANVVAVDSHDNVFAAGYVRNSGAGKDIVLVKWNSAGAALLGTPTILAGNSNRDDAALSLAVDSQDNAFIGGYQTRQRAGVPDQ